jgi:hypothetical protein
MEDLFAKLSELLKNSIRIDENKDKLSIKLEIKNKDLVPPGDIGKPFEIQEMIRVFGGLKHDIPMEINVNEDTKIITIKLSNKENFEVVSSAMKNVWDRASELLIKAFYAEPGKTEEFRDLGDFNEKY